MNGFELFGQLVAGWLLADLIGGILHWWEDRAARADWPLLGRHVVQPNRLHHSDPLDFTRASFLRRNWTTWAATALVSLPWLALFGPSPLWAAATLGGLVANEVHRFAHLPEATPAWLKPLQQAGLVQSPAHHARHHLPDATARYCILTDLLNPLLDRMGMWRAIERGLAAIGRPVNGGAR